MVDAKVRVEDQPLPTHASPAPLSSSYIADSDPEEDLKEDHADYPVDGGDDDDESSDYYDDDDDNDPVPLAEDTKAFKTDESTPTPPSPRPLRARISVRLPPPMRASMEARIVEYASTATPPLPPPSLLSPWSSLLPQFPSPPLPLPSPPTSPIYAEAPLGYKAAMIRLRAASPPTNNPSEIPSPPLLLPSIAHRDDILEADMLL
ncbi:hypothetical protein Tco_0981618 [Tanacetum coccineum]